jgi:hypothetical protein
MAKDEPKHTVIVDADLHIQDPHEIILSYFDAKNDSAIVTGSRIKYRNATISIFAMLVFMKFFFQEMITGPLFFIASAITFLILSFIFAEGLIFFLKILNASIRKDSLRGFFFQITFITLIVIMIGIFA